MMCDRCDEPIIPSEGETLPLFGASGAGGEVYVHKDPCHVPPRLRPQSYPQERRR